MAEGLVGGLLIGSLLTVCMDQVKLGAREDMRVRLDCTSAGSDRMRMKLTILSVRNKDNVGHSRTKDTLGDRFVDLDFFLLGHELEIPTESMGYKC